MLPDPVRRAACTPPRLRIEASQRQRYIEWEVLEVLVRLAQESNLAVDVECITADGASLMLSLE
jgi:hypothetical protein